MQIIPVTPTALEQRVGLPPSERESFDLIVGRNESDFQPRPTMDIYSFGSLRSCPISGFP